MTGRTNPLLLALYAVACGVVMWAVETWVTAARGAAFVPSIALGATLVALAIAAFVLGWPIRRYTASLRKLHDAAQAHEDTNELRRTAASNRIAPERATFVLAFAKAIALAGSMFLGGCAGVTVYLATRTVASGRVGESLVSTIAAVVLLVAGLIVESWCMLPPDGPESDAEESAEGMRANPA